MRPARDHRRSFASANSTNTTTKNVSRCGRVISIEIEAVFRSGVVRTFRSAVTGRPEGLHYMEMKNAVVQTVRPA